MKTVVYRIVEKLIIKMSNSISLTLFDINACHYDFGVVLSLLFNYWNDILCSFLYWINLSVAFGVCNERTTIGPSFEYVASYCCLEITCFVKLLVLSEEVYWCINFLKVGWSCSLLVSCLPTQLWFYPTNHMWGQWSHGCPGTDAGTSI